MFKVNVENLEPYLVNRLIEEVNLDGGNAEQTQDQKEIQVEIPNIINRVKFLAKVRKMKAK